MQYAFEAINADDADREQIIDAICAAYARLLERLARAGILDFMNVVDAAMKRQLFSDLSEVLPYGQCLLDWKIEHHAVDSLDVGLARWPDAKEGDVVVQGYIRYQIPKGTP